MEVTIPAGTEDLRRRNREITFDGLEVPAEDVLIGEGADLKITQIRVGPARLSHRMRWLGLAGRCVEIARNCAAERHGVGVRLACRESVQLLLAALAMEIEVGRLLAMKAVWELDHDGYTRKAVSMAKSHVADLLHSVADTAIKISGARCYSKDTMLDRIYRCARQARLVDGAAKAHKMVLNRALEKEHLDFWRWPARDDRATGAAAA